jgi:VIT1/CCC1 family predicted Fe2+/Mn2+ transporter
MEKNSGNFEPVRHYTDEADKFRTKVFGIQDGLIGVGSIAIGAAGFEHNVIAVLVAGLIATIGQGFSMGIGEYISTRVRMQVINNEMKKERTEIEKYPDMEKEELVQFYLDKGLNEDDAKKIAEKIWQDKEKVLQEMMANELKIFPEDFESPVRLGLIMSMYLVIGGLLPLLPFIVGEFLHINFYVFLASSIVIALTSLGIFGAMGSKFTGLSKWRGAVEQIVTGSLALIGSYAGGMVLAHFFPATLLP